MKRALLSLFVAITISACNFNRNKNVWTPKYEKEVYNEVNDDVKTMFKDETQKKKFISFFVQQTKKELPNGLESVSADSLHKIAVRIGREFNATYDVTKLVMTVPWSDEAERSFKANFMEKYLKTGSMAKGNKICSCIIIGLKEYDPDSLSIHVSDTILNRIVADCKNKL